MSKQLTKEKYLPNAKTIDLKKTPIKVDAKVLNTHAIRRGKVRQLMRMGYNGPQIYDILSKGIKVENEKGEEILVEVGVDLRTIQNDMQYVKQEIASENDVSLVEKRAEAMDRLQFLYQRAVIEYNSAKGQAKNSFLNTALSVLTKIMEVEGVKTSDGEGLNSRPINIHNTAVQLNTLDQHDKQTILATIRGIIEQRKPIGSGDTSIPDGTSRVRTQASVDEGIPGES